MSEIKDPEEILQDAIEMKQFIALCQLESIIHNLSTESTDAFTVQEFTGVQLVGKLKSQVYSVLEENMQEMYIAAGWGWDEEAKRMELFHMLSRFLVILDNNNKVAAYTMFRFEWDDEDEPEYPVLFLYEIQVAEKHRGKNLGSSLLNCLKSISGHVGTIKILLTCLKLNTKALQFYEKNGFKIDSNSPSACGFEESYELLSCRTL